jgi:hypothetical protein
MFLPLQKKFAIAGFFIIILMVIPLTLFLLEKKQENQTHAQSSGSTSLYFNPTSTQQNPLVHKIGDSIPVAMYVNPGQDMDTFIKFQISYDPTKLSVSQTDPFTVNTSAFPTVVEGPVLGNGTISEEVSVGADPTKAIQKTAEVGTINLNAVGSTGSTPTTVTFTNVSQVLSSASTDQAAQNVLSSTDTAYVTIAASGTTPTTTPVPTLSATSTPIPTGTTTVLSFDILLDGIGAAGDNANPASDLSNKNPLHPVRTLEVQIYDTKNNLAASSSASIAYNSSAGDFEGQADLGTNFPAGNYAIDVKTNDYLRKLVPGIINIVPLTNNPVPPVNLVAGDILDQNVLNILDYNALLDCGYGQINPLPIADPNATFNSPACQVHKPVQNIDDNDDGIVNSTDYNLWLRELSVQYGQ